MPRKLGTLLAILLMATPSPGVAVQEPDASRPRVAVVPFHNTTGEAAASLTVMSQVWEVLEKKGFRLAGNGEIEKFLRQRRIRTRNAMSLKDARDLAEMLDAHYLLVGTIDAWEINGGPEVGLTARVVDPAREMTVWSGSVTLHAAQVPGLIAEGRPKNLPKATRKAVRDLFGDLTVKKKDGTVRPSTKNRRGNKTFLASPPISYRSPEFDRKRQYRIALLPFDNLTRSPSASPLVTDHLEARMLTIHRVDLVDPGELRRVLVEQDIQPYYGLGADRLRLLADELGVDAVLEGSVLEFDNGNAPVPRIDLYARLRDTRTGEILWMATTRREGHETRSVYDLGVVRGIDRLTDQAVSDLLSTW